MYLRVGCTKSMKITFPTNFMTETSVPIGSNPTNAYTIVPIKSNRIFCKPIKYLIPIDTILLNGGSTTPN